MGASIALPALITIVVGLATGRLHRQLRPSLAVVGYTFLAAIGSVAAASSVVMFALLVLGRMPILSGRLSWCRSLAADHQVPFWIATADACSAGP